MDPIPSQEALAAKDIANDITTDAVMASSDAEQAVLPPPVIGEPTPLSVGPVNLRNTSLVVLAALAGLYVLHWAQAVFVPLLLGLMFSYALTPLVNRMVRLGIPRGLSAALLVAGILGGVGSLGYRLADDAAWAAITSRPSRRAGLYSVDSLPGKV